MKLTALGTLALGYADSGLICDAPCGTCYKLSIGDSDSSYFRVVNPNGSEFNGDLASILSNDSDTYRPRNKSSAYKPSNYRRPYDGSNVVTPSQVPQVIPIYVPSSNNNMQYQPINDYPTAPPPTYVFVTQPTIDNYDIPFPVTTKKPRRPKTTTEAAYESYDEESEETTTTRRPKRTTTKKPKTTTAAVEDSYESYDVTTTERPTERPTTTKKATTTKRATRPAYDSDSDDSNRNTTKKPSTTRKATTTKKSTRGSDDSGRTTRKPSSTQKSGNGSGDSDSNDRKITTTKKPTTTQAQKTAGCGGVAAWDKSQVYSTNCTKVCYNDEIWVNKWWTTNEVPKEAEGLPWWNYSQNGKPPYTNPCDM